MSKLGKYSDDEKEEIENAPFNSCNTSNSDDEIDDSYDSDGDLQKVLSYLTRELDIDMMPDIMPKIGSFYILMQFKVAKTMSPYVMRTPKFMICISVAQDLWPLPRPEEQSRITSYGLIENDPDLGHGLLEVEDALDNWTIDDEDELEENDSKFLYSGTI
ncbi:hypothetical protein Cgig2_023442 [Carnegiea gigantea]|uniref:Uncharacterized protein n=1 Tax=Carnegiea gigantea TaxID=171969 RepID=A0A9Q1GKD7_9CARY|nr:hypothetical protein Cgig2_023442 [Carnegiea gigantea]